jgi:pyruvate, orthophosphate dikinase
MVAIAAKYIILLDGNTLPPKELIGGKAWSLCRMKSMGLSVPPAVVITTEACLEYLETGEFPSCLRAEIRESVTTLEKETGRQFGGEKPLLLSVRSGAEVSMPGMMDTVLNLGINGRVEKALALEMKDDGFAQDTHRRFLSLYTDIVLKTLTPIGEDEQIGAILERLANESTAVPECPYEQLFSSVEAVFSSWNSRRAKRYRKHNKIPEKLGTAVVIQAMVFGNMDHNSGTGVLFSRNPLNGVKKPYGEYLNRAQGEDVVSGTCTPEPISALLARSPSLYHELIRSSEILEHENADVQDIEFTIQDGKLFLLQSRSAKRSPEAAVSFAIDMVCEGLITKETALSRVSSEQVRTLLRPKLVQNPDTSPSVLVKGESACYGVGLGLVVASSDEAERLADQGQKVVLARVTTSPEDVHGMIASCAVITEQGGSTSHAAVVGRALGVPCIVGCGENSLSSLVGQMVTVDATNGIVYAGFLDVEEPSEADDSRLVMLKQWVDELCPIKVVFCDAHASKEALNLDDIIGSDDLFIPHGALQGYEAVRGSMIDSGKGVSNAVEAGVKTLVTKHPLAVALTALECCKDITNT